MNFVIPGITGRSNILGVAGIENALNSQERNYIFSNIANPTAVAVSVAVPTNGSSVITLSRYYAWVWSAVQPPTLGSSLATKTAFNFFDQNNRPLFNNPVLVSTLFGDDNSIDYPMLPLRPLPPTSKIKIVWSNLSTTQTLGFEIILRGFEVLDDLKHETNEQKVNLTGAGGRLQHVG